MGTTQNQLKTPMGQHFSDVRALINTKKVSDTNAARFASHYQPNSRPSIAQIKSMVEMSVIWQGSPITCMKGLGNTAAHFV